MDIAASSIARDRSRQPAIRRPGHSVLEMLVIIGVMTILMGLLLPALQAARESSRRLGCANNLRQLSLATLGFHSANGAFPQIVWDSKSQGNTWGQFVRLLPYLEQTVVFNKSDFSKPVSDPANIWVRTASIPMLLCPSDHCRLTNAADPNADAEWTKTNYRGNAGSEPGATTAGVEANNGIFVTGKKITVDRIYDGKGDTALFSESLLGDGDNNLISTPGDWFSINPAGKSVSDFYAAMENLTPARGAASQLSYGGRTYTSGEYLDTRYNHVSLPNSKSVVAASGESLITAVNHAPQATAASSQHPGGVNLATADGSVRFIKNDVSIDVWRALGSIAGDEKVAGCF
jgi:prepilin-type processing-associated H-X9-DG protein